MADYLVKLVGGVGIALIIGSILSLVGSNLNLPSFSTLGVSVEIFAYVVLFIGLLFAFGEVFGVSLEYSLIISFIITFLVALILYFL
jgi:hypothetical protein